MAINEDAIDWNAVRSSRRTGEPHATARLHPLEVPSHPFTKDKQV